MREKAVRDVMLPLEHYAVVPEDATLLDAVRALEKAQGKVPPDRQPHRAVLVVDESGAIVGKVGHFAFLAGLEPKIGRLDSGGIPSHAGLSKGFLSSVMESLPLWSAGLDELREHARTRRVAEFMRPVAIQVDENAPLARAIHELIAHQTLSLLVTREGEVVGILRLTDVFQEVFTLLRNES